VSEAVWSVNIMVVMLLIGVWFAIFMLFTYDD